MSAPYYWSYTPPGQASLFASELHRLYVRVDPEPADRFAFCKRVAHVIYRAEDRAALDAAVEALRLELGCTQLSVSDD